MENKELDPKRFFVFLNPLDTEFDDENFNETDTFGTRYEDPYLYFDVSFYEETMASGGGCELTDEQKSQFGFTSNLREYCLPYLYNNQPIYKDGTTEYRNSEITHFEHTLWKMGDSDVHKVFVERALEYYNRPFELFENYEFTLFMGFHYESYRGQLSDFLERIEIIIKTLDGDSSKIYDISSIHLLRLRKQLTLWVNEKRSELNEIDGLEIATVPQPEVREVEEIDPVVFEKVSHKLVYLHEIGVYDFLKDKYKTLYKTPIKFAELLASVMGIVEPKEIENLRKCIGYIETTNKKNPINDLSLKKVRAELLKLGIEKSSN